MVTLELTLHLFTNPENFGRKESDRIKLHSNVTIKELKDMVIGVRGLQKGYSLLCFDDRTKTMLQDTNSLEECGFQPGARNTINVIVEETLAEELPEDRVQLEDVKRPETDPVTPANGAHTDPVATARGTEEEPTVGWPCPSCTFINEPWRPGCEICGTDKPPNYNPPDEYVPSEEEKRRIEEERKMDEAFNSIKLRDVNYEAHLRLDEQLYALNPEPFECPICFEDVDLANGVILRTCCHMFCLGCLRGHIKASENPRINCPDDDCECILEDREIRGIAGNEGFKKHMNHCSRVAEGTVKNSFHCKTPDCPVWVMFQDKVNFFDCPACKRKNCVTCGAIHEGQSCRRYQNDLKQGVNVEAKESLAALEKMIKTGEAMRCPCGIIIQKKGGCDWVQCSMCMLEICWPTKGPRWGPKGRGDTSGGCQCMLKGKKCHTSCVFCH